MRKMRQNLIYRRANEGSAPQEGKSHKNRCNKEDRRNRRLSCDKNTQICRESDETEKRQRSQFNRGKKPNYNRACLADFCLKLLWDGLFDGLQTHGVYTCLVKVYTMLFLVFVGESHERHNIWR